MDRALDLEELELEERLLDNRDDLLLEALLEELFERRLDLLLLEEDLLELLLSLFDVLLMGATMSTILLLLREEELEEDLDDTDEDKLDLELLERELEERELLELEEAVLFFRPGTRIFLSFISTFPSSRISSSSLTLITLTIFSAAFSPTWISISIFSMTGPAAATK